MAIANAAYDCFTYITNDRLLYDLLGEAIIKLELFAKRARTTPRSILNHYLDEMATRQWYTLTNKIIDQARQDYRKNFAEEASSVDHPEWLDDVRVVDVLRIALLHRDYWRNNG